MSRSGSTPLAVADGPDLLGVIELKDVVKEGIRERFAEMRSTGIRMILEHVWGRGYERESHYLKVCAYRIRRKLGDEAGHFLQSDPSVGYRLVPPADRP